MDRSVRDLKTSLASFFLFLPLVVVVHGSRYQCVLFGSNLVYNKDMLSTCGSIDVLITCTREGIVIDSVGRKRWLVDDSKL